MNFKMWLNHIVECINLKGMCLICLLQNTFFPQVNVIKIAKQTWGSKHPFSE